MRLRLLLVQSSDSSNISELLLPHSAQKKCYKTIAFLLKRNLDRRVFLRFQRYITKISKITRRNSSEDFLISSSYSSKKFSAWIRTFHSLPRLCSRKRDWKDTWTGDHSSFFINRFTSLGTTKMDSNKSQIIGHNTVQSRPLLEFSVHEQVCGCSTV